MIVVPCPRCGSWMTDPLDKKHELWVCNHMDCMTLFKVKSHHALILLKDGGVIRVDKRHQCKVQ